MTQWKDCNRCIRCDCNEETMFKMLNHHCPRFKTSSITAYRVFFGSSQYFMVSGYDRKMCCDTASKIMNQQGIKRAILGVPILFCGYKAQGILEVCENKWNYESLRNYKSRIGKDVFLDSLDLDAHTEDFTEVFNVPKYEWPIMAIHAHPNVKGDQ